MRWRRCRHSPQNHVGIPDAPTLHMKCIVRYTRIYIKERQLMSVDTHPSGEGYQSCTWKHILSAWSAGETENLPRQWWLTTSYHTEVMNIWCGAKATGKACANVVTIRKQDGLTANRNMDIIFDPPGGWKSQKYGAEKTAAPLRVNFRKISIPGYNKKILKAL